MDPTRKHRPIVGPRVAAALAAVTLPLSAGCHDNHLPPNPVPDPASRAPVPAWFDPNAVWNPQSGDSRVYIEGKIVFDVDRATIRPESDPVLEKLLKFLQDRPDITRLRIEGHTDSTASDEYNQELSAKRSLAVCDWLVDRGVDNLRLIAVGFGKKKPIAPNNIPAGRAENRRTEFHVAEVNGRPFGANDFEGGMVLTVLSAEERERLKHPPKVEIAKAQPFTPEGNVIKDVKPPPPKSQDDDTPGVQVAPKSKK